MADKPKYPGNWVVTMLLEGAMSTQREQVAAIAAQIGSSVMPDNAGWVNRFSVQSDSSDRVYTVAQRRTDGTWGCSCPGWRHHRNCKHESRILARLAQLATVAPATDQTQLASGVVDMLASASSKYDILRIN